jgi:non-ribosomal peptide synthetase-like protein
MGIEIASRTPVRAPTRVRTLLDVFATTVARCPDRIALDAPDAVLTYAELSAAAESVARRLAGVGIGRGDRVTVRVRSGTAELYTAILGVLHAGAAYVPIDADDPPARAREIRDRAAVAAEIGDGLRVEPVRRTAAAAGRQAGGSEVTARPTPDDDAWIIFTSGSTGAPKGVAITHRSAAAFVDAEAQLWTVAPEDRVLAGLSVAFDASCEEMWLAWRHGATLVPAPRDLVRAGGELGDWIIDRGITVVSTVPTLAAMWDESCLNRVNLLILGGEACPESLGWRLAAGREVWNTYGPTEATVVSTAARIVPGEPITIGWALDGWEVAVLDGGAPVALGEPGELVIGGVGLGRYLDPALDDERFAPIPALGWERAYRTGDIVRATTAGLEFVGRRDDQVKIGGRRIELGEIEAALSTVPGVRAAAAAVRESAAGNRLLVGYVVGDVDTAEVRAHVGRSLPAGIVPLVVGILDLPRGTSGKVDRKALPWPVGGDAEGRDAGIAADGSALTDTEVWLAERWCDQIGPVPVTPHSDFFALGGASLAAAKLVSALRQRYPTVAVADVYRHPTLRELAHRLDALGRASDAVRADIVPRPLARLGLMQLAGVFVLFAIQAVPWLLATLAYGDLVAIGTPHVAWVWLIGAWIVLGSPPARTAMHVLLARALLRDLRPGRYSRHSWLACRLWFVDRLADFTRTDRFGGTPWADRYARLVGADVGRGARLAAVPPAGALLHIGEGATVEPGVDMRGWWIDGQELIVGEIHIGAGARIGTRTLLNPGAVVGEGAETEPGSVIYGAVPAGERWGGSPARRLGRAGQDWPAEAPPAGAGRRSLFVLGMALESAIAIVSVLPSLGIFALISAPEPTLGTSPFVLMWEAALLAAVTVPVDAVLLALALRLVWRAVKPGWHADHESVGWALWLGGELQASAHTLLFPLYASLYTRRWFRLMGIDIGRRTEISLTGGLNPLVSFGEMSQCTDDIAFCGVRARNGWLRVDPISIGDRSFLGPGAILRGGTRIGDDSLVGVMTVPPVQPAAGTSWLGVPALELPRVPDPVDPSRTVSPPRRLICARGTMDLVRLLCPTAIAIVIEALEVLVLAWLCANAGLMLAVLCAPFVLLSGGVAGTAVTVAVKWSLIGRYRRSEHPLWSSFVWRDELINTSQEQLAGELLLRFALGTPLMSLYLRAMGARVGRGVWCETLAVTEYDMIDLGDGAVLNRGSCLMTHLFHDRLLRIGPTQLAPGATLGPTAAVLPDTVVGAGTTVCGHSVVMRGEELPAGSRWQGVPVAPATR